MQKAITTVDLESEFKHVLSFVKAHWKTNNDIDPILKMVWQKGIEKSQPFQFVDNHSGFLLSIMEMNFNNNLISRDKKSMAYDAHKPFMLHRKFSSFNRKIEESMSFNIYQEQKQIKNEIKKSFPKYHQNKPIGWQTFWRKYNSDCDHAENEEYYENTFMGHQVVKFQSPALFPTCTTLPNLAYRHERDDTHPLFYLSNAVFAHAFNTTIFNNSYAIAVGFRDIEKYFNQEEFKDVLVNDFNFSDITQNPFILSLEKSLPPALSNEEIQKEYTQNAKVKADFEALTPEEQMEKTKKDKEDLLASLSDLIKTRINKI